MRERDAERERERKGVRNLFEKQGEKRYKTIETLTWLNFDNEKSGNR